MSSLASPLFAEVLRRANLARQQAHSTPPLRHVASRPALKMTRCPVCKLSVKVIHLKNHMAKTHKHRSAQSRPTPVQPANDPRRKTTTLVSPRDKNLDATKPYAHAYREQGRYGSHPSHDGFDDESTPE